MFQAAGIISGGVWCIELKRIKEACRSMEECLGAIEERLVNVAVQRFRRIATLGFSPRADSYKGSTPWSRGGMSANMSQRRSSEPTLGYIRLSVHTAR